MFAFIVEIILSVACDTSVIPSPTFLYTLAALAKSVASDMLYPHFCYYFFKKKRIGHFCLPLHFHYPIIGAGQIISSSL